MSSNTKRKLKRSQHQAQLKAKAAAAAADAIVNELVDEAVAKATTTKTAADYVQPITAEFNAFTEAEADLRTAIVKGECAILARAIALGKLLAAAKAALMVENQKKSPGYQKPTSWKSWIKANLPEGLGPSSVNLYIRLTENEDTIKDASSIRAAIKLLPRQRTAKKAKANADADDYNDDNDNADDDANDNADDDANDNDNATGHGGYSDVGDLDGGRGGYSDAGDLDSDKHLDSAFVAKSAETLTQLQFMLRAGVPLLTQSHKQALRRLVIELTSTSVGPTSNKAEGAGATIRH